MSYTVVKYSWSIYIYGIQRLLKKNLIFLSSMVNEQLTIVIFIITKPSNKV